MMGSRCSRLFIFNWNFNFSDVMNHYKQKMFFGKHFFFYHTVEKFTLLQKEKMFEMCFHFKLI